jgi:hypothetical protein
LPYNLRQKKTGFDGKILDKILDKRLQKISPIEKIIKLDYERNYPVLQKMPIIFEHPPILPLTKRKCWI